MICSIVDSVHQRGVLPVETRLIHPRFFAASCSTRVKRYCQENRLHSANTGRWNSACDRLFDSYLRFKALDRISSELNVVVHGEQWTSVFVESLLAISISRVRECSKHSITVSISRTLRADQGTCGPSESPWQLNDRQVSTVGL